MVIIAITFDFDRFELEPITIDRNDPSVPLINSRISVFHYLGNHQEIPNTATLVMPVLDTLTTVASSAAHLLSLLVPDGLCNTTPAPHPPPDLSPSPPPTTSEPPSIPSP
ncbi:hypothetical protein L2E82_14534 [Cichorium intybus]|uniref:Uncharacterized protein n=1 Tax=Cichorium intybus TaxID=13427 RepID=A0ACB9F144_CICIN|nr:hypothetical protein L2E82_14534 [Cichorium intybus]